ncbi:MAG: hypothetical protein R2910_13070 [Gemmatimonadales bacterium]
MRTAYLAFLVLLGACSSGQQASTSAAPAPASDAEQVSATSCPIAVGTTVLSTEFTSTGERARIDLVAGCRYNATTDVGGIQLQLRPRMSGTQSPYVGQLMSGGVQGGSTWEIRATTSGEYNVWVTGAQSGRAVRLEVTVRGDNAPKSR